MARAHLHVPRRPRLQWNPSRHLTGTIDHLQHHDHMALSSDDCNAAIYLAGFLIRGG